MTGKVRAKFRLVMNLIPHHGVRFTRGAGCANGEDEASVPGHDQQLQDLKTQTRGRLLTMLPQEEAIS